MIKRSISISRFLAFGCATCNFQHFSQQRCNASELCVHFEILWFLGLLHGVCSYKTIWGMLFTHFCASYWCSPSRWLIFRFLKKPIDDTLGHANDTIKLGRILFVCPRNKRNFGITFRKSKASFVRLNRFSWAAIWRHLDS